MPCSWEGNPTVWRRTGHASQTIVFLHLRGHGLRKGDAHPPIPSRSVAQFTFTLFMPTHVDVEQQNSAW